MTLGNRSLEPRDLCLTELSNVGEIIPQKMSENSSLDRMAERFKFLASNTLQNAHARKVLGTRTQYTYTYPGVTG